MMLEFLRSRLDDLVDADKARIQPLGHAPDRAAFAGRIRAFHHDDQRFLAFPQDELGVEGAGSFEAEGVASTEFESRRKGSANAAPKARATPLKQVSAI